MKSLTLTSRIAEVGLALTTTLLVTAGTLCLAETEGFVRSWTFEQDPVSTQPKDVQVGTLFDGRPAGDWRVVEVADAPSPTHALAQLTDRGAEHAYKVALTAGTESGDLDLEVAFKAVSGRGDMGGGLIWRAPPASCGALLYFSSRK